VAKACSSTRDLLKAELGTFEPIERLLEEFIEFQKAVIDMNGGSRMDAGTNRMMTSIQDIMKALRKV
jgi:hypothetical protein